jgi:hypothetical protein
MLPSLQFFLNTTPEQADRLQRLQSAFAAACNLVAPLAQANRCWNRVALHHLAYRELRSRFPQLGSQMACNAVYSVARTYRILLQHPKSPCNIERHPSQPLPLLQFRADAPVYFDRHTLSLKGSLLSMFSLDGRLHFQLHLAEKDAARFARDRLCEVMLRRVGERFLLQFWFDEKAALLASEMKADLPEYVVMITPAARDMHTPAPSLSELAVNPC